LQTDAQASLQTDTKSVNPLKSVLESSPIWIWVKIWLRRSRAAFARDRSLRIRGFGLSAILSKMSSPLSGEARVPGDKSVSHRALMLGGVAIGETRIEGLLEGEDVLATADAMRLLGATITRDEDGSWQVIGCGVGGLNEPAGVLDLGNSGTAVRLLMGLAGGHAFSSTFTGDASLCRRPMERIMAPLRDMGIQFTSREGGRLPITVTGPDTLLPIAYTLPVASAQVKSAILLAGLNTPGKTTVIEPQATRDHSELMLRHFGAEVVVDDLENGTRRITLTGQPELEAADIVVPGDISSAAFPLTAAVLVAGSQIMLRGIGVNPLRAGLITTLREMGAKISIENLRGGEGDPLADLSVRAGQLRGIDVPAERAPSMIDEYPILAVAAACAEGTTRMNGLAELRVKESDRLAAMAKGLALAGVQVEETEDSLIVHGTGRPPHGGAMIEADLDHRIAMAFLVLGMVSEQPMTIDDASPIDTSFPGFAELINGLGGNIGALTEN
jgi:3-phosphoshikimate 1-carboxyvinyltransferase